MGCCTKTLFIVYSLWAVWWMW